MLEISKVNVSGVFSEFLDITWVIKDTIEDINKYKFSVYQCLSPEGEYTKIGDNITEFSYQWPVSNRVNSSIHYYFKIGVENLDTLEFILSSVFGALYLVPRDNVAEAIAYQYKYFLENILNRPPAKLLIKKRTGQRCPVCWNEELQETTRSQCKSCYNIGYVGGYSPPQNIFISFTEPGFNTKFDIGDIKDIQNSVSQAWAANYPLILPDDIIVDEFGRRFKVLNMQPTTKDGRIYLRQMLQLQLLPPTDVSYSIKV